MKWNVAAGKRTAWCIAPIVLRSALDQHHLAAVLTINPMRTDPKFLKNQRYAKHGTEKAVREARAGIRATA